MTANIKILILSVLIFTIFFSVSAQEKEYIIVKGTVIDNSLREISYANIISKKTGLGNICKEDGSFNLRVLNNDTLIFSAISYKKKYIAVNKLISENNYVTLELLIYDLASIDIIGLSKWEEFKDEFIRKKLEPMEQEILAIEGLPDPFQAYRIVSANVVMNPISFLYEKFNKEAVRKRKQERWNSIYEKTYIKKE
ncbi:MAG: carboxypeptidase-like regulatory domain-containing protein [Bacteroidales bacterium]|nr:carboxypeptidase-like regulatory domain-containing protein [Bacteroidales bacterium]